MDSSDERTPTGRDAFTALVVVSGVALAGYGSYLHLTIAAQVRAGQCDGCSPWHPLFVLAPMLVGVTLLIFGTALLYRR